LELLKAIVLGIVQGLTEFIPVSSSAHLVITPWLLGWPPQSLFYDLVLHWGTLVAVFAVFWRDFWAITVAVLRSFVTRSLADPEARLGWLIVIGSIPAVLAGFFFNDFFEALFADPFATGRDLVITALLLAGSEWLIRRSQQQRDLKQLNLVDTIVIGIAQAVALWPGISRSGSTIAAGLVRGIRRDDAARFSFLLGTPAILGAGLLQLVDVLQADSGAVATQVPVLVIGFVVSAITGYASIRFLLSYLRTHNLYIFAAYCLVVGVGVMILAQVWA
jgi:undecaprenyl-diphosphatase